MVVDAADGGGLAHRSLSSIDLSAGGHQPMVSADGKPSVPLNQNQRLVIHKHPNKLTLLHPPGVDFFEACRTKLGWNSYAEEFSMDN